MLWLVTSRGRHDTRRFHQLHRAESLSKDKQLPLQMIPVILREADVPGFAKSRNWIDFRDESKYCENVWNLVWGILGHNPAEVLDLKVAEKIKSEMK